MTEEKEFYYQIKGKHSDPENGYGLYGGSQTWVFPPLFSGKVSAKDKKEAKLRIEEEYGRQFPIRVLKKDLDSNEFLLKIEEMSSDGHYKTLFELKNCEHCGKGFYLIEKYNDKNCTNKGDRFCSDKCKDDVRFIESAIRNENLALQGNKQPVIYKITNKKTGMIYIGKTNQVFTLRWYQHFFQHGDCKFHKAIKESQYTDWLFEIIEIINFSSELKNNELEQLILDRERFYINEFNSINEGYNSL